MKNLVLALSCLSLLALAACNDKPKDDAKPATSSAAPAKPAPSASAAKPAGGGW
jgi:hypothetical protein